MTDLSASSSTLFQMALHIENLLPPSGVPNCPWPSKTLSATSLNPACTLAYVYHSCLMPRLKIPFILFILLSHSISLHISTSFCDSLAPVDP